MNDFEIEDPLLRTIDRLHRRSVKNDYYMVGSVRKQGDKTCFTYGKTYNGFCFKDERAFVERSGVCYIPEYEFEAYTTYAKCLCYEGDDIPMGFYTYESILDEIENYAWCVLDDKLLQISDKLRWAFYDKCATDIFNMADWKDPLSLLYADYDINEVFEQFLEQNK